MSKITVAYWSGTGNTEAMAEAVGEGIKAAGKECAVVSISDISASDLEGETSFALGCPAMGAEVLEEGEMEPFVTEVEGFAAGKTIGLFGSYGWGGQSAGLVNAELEACKFHILMDPVKIQYVPSEESLKELSDKVAAVE